VRITVEPEQILDSECQTTRTGGGFAVESRAVLRDRADARRPAIASGTHREAKQNQSRPLVTGHRSEEEHLLTRNPTKADSQAVINSAKRTRGWELEQIGYRFRCFAQHLYPPHATRPNFSDHGRTPFVLSLRDHAIWSCLSSSSSSCIATELLRSQQHRRQKPDAILELERR